jgi:RNA polymerase sigma-70 factor (ECF subfamily)
MAGRAGPSSRADAPQSPAPATRPDLRQQDDRSGPEVRVDDEAFLDALTEHLDRLHNLARGLTRSPQDAEDLVSETCVLALRGWRRCPPDDPAAWLATVCLNAARSSYRKRSARPVEVQADAWLQAQVDDGADTARSALSAVQATRVREALAGLPTPQQEAITLMDLGGYTAAQTAQILGAPRGTVLARVHRGRKALARTLVDERAVSW